MRSLFPELEVVLEAELPELDVLLLDELDEEELGGFGFAAVVSPPSAPPCFS